MRQQRGQTAAEYMGLLLVVLAIIAALAGSSIGATVAGGMKDLICAIGGQECETGQPVADAGPDRDGDGVSDAREAELGTDPGKADSDGDGVVDGEDPVPDGVDVDGDGLSDGEEVALGSDPRNADSDGDGIGDLEEYEQGTDPTQGVLPMTEENVLEPWLRVGMTEDEWRELEDAILDEVNPDGWEGFLFGPTAAGVTLDENGELKLIEIQQAGLNPGALLRALGAGGRALSATGAAARAALKLPAATRATLRARGILPGIARARPPLPPRAPGVVLNSLDELGRPTGAAATITRELLGTGSAASRSILPPGFAGQAANHARGHLIARSLGGSGRDPRNLVTLFNRGANSPVMRDFEAQVANAVRAGQTVRYEVVPIYRGAELMPRAVTLRAAGSGGFRLDVTVLNKPGGLPPPRTPPLGPLP
jgi:hypothetical protein